MKLIPEQVRIIEQKLEQAKKDSIGYQDFFAAATVINGENNYTIDDGADRITKSQYYLLRQQIKEYKEALERAERIRDIKTDKIALGTKFSLQFAGEKESEQFTLVDIGLGLDTQYITMGSEVGKKLWHLKAGDSFSVILKNGNKVFGTVTDILTNPKEYVKYIISTKHSHRVSKLYHPIQEEQVLTETQRKLLLLEKNILATKINKEKRETEQFADGTKVTIQIGKKEPKTYTIVDKPEYIINPETEISINSNIVQRLYSRKKDGTFYLYEKPFVKGNSKKIAKLLDINQENVYSKREKSKTLRSLSRRMTAIEKILKQAKDINPEENGDSIGIGSHVSMMIKDETGIKTRRVEIIQQAVSYELETDYVEASSPLGVRIIGLTENDKISCSTGRGCYEVMVYDIDNHKESTKTTNPMNYQNIKK